MYRLTVSNMRYKKVVFCSNDCTYRAPVAVEVFKRKLDKMGLLEQIEVVAKGMLVMFPEPVNGKAVAIGKSKGYDLTKYRALAIDEEDFSIDTLVLAMTEVSKQKLYDTYTNAINVYSVKEFIGVTGDVDMPFGKGLADYGENFSQLEELIEQVAEKIEYMVNN